MELIVFRKYFGEKYTVGQFYANDKALCNTMEPVVRILKDLNGDGDFLDPGEGKIMGKTAIPCERYNITMEIFARHNRMTPLLHMVPGFTEIFIHGGADVTWSAGCILVGENKVKGQLINYGYWETTISNLITEALKTESVWLTVKQMDPYKC
jgi:hypothetical protein